VLALGLYAAWTAGRLDRQHLRLDAARAALDAALTLRAELAGVNRGLGSIERPETAIDLSHERERAENQVSRAIREELESDRLDPAQRAQLLDAVTRAGFVRRFHNDAVRDALALRRRRMVRLLHLFGHAPLPQYFEIDDVASEISDVARASAPYD
jgi:hypothetical protein